MIPFFIFFNMAKKSESAELDNKLDNPAELDSGNKYSHYSDIAEGNALNDAEREAKSLLNRMV